MNIVTDVSNQIQASMPFQASSVSKISKLFLPISLWLLCKTKSTPEEKQPKEHIAIPPCQFILCSSKWSRSWCMRCFILDHIQSHLRHCLHFNRPIFSLSKTVNNFFLLYSESKYLKPQQFLFAHNLHPIHHSSLPPENVKFLQYYTNLTSQLHTFNTITYPFGCLNEKLSNEYKFCMSQDAKVYTVIIFTTLYILINQ